MAKLILPDKKLLGPCFGIQRALNECLQIKNKKEYLMYGQIGHNRKLCALLKKEGIGLIKNLKELKDKNKKIIIRGHGINKKDQCLLKEKKINYLDLTCPFVKRFLEKTLEFEKKNYQIIIIGRKNHIEIRNILSFLKSPIIIEKISEIKNIPFCEKIACFSQTTQIFSKIKKFLPLIKKRAKKFIYIETRCFETQKRQEEVKELSQEVDLMIVVGDNNSENTRNLLRIAQKNTKSILVSNIRNLNKKRIKKAERIGIIAGASTLIKNTEEIIDFIKNYADKKINKRKIRRT